MYSEIENSKSSWLDINQNEVESADKIYNTLLLQNILRYKTKKKRLRKKRISFLYN